MPEGRLLVWVTISWSDRALSSFKRGSSLCLRGPLLGLKGPFMSLRGPSPGLRGPSPTAELHGRITKVTEHTGVPQATGLLWWAGLWPDPNGDPKATVVPWTTGTFNVIKFVYIYIIRSYSYFLMGPCVDIVFYVGPPWTPTVFWVTWAYGGPNPHDPHGISSPASHDLIFLARGTKFWHARDAHVPFEYIKYKTF